MPAYSPRHADAIAAPPASQLDSASAAFSRSFGRPPRWAACAPGRGNLIGEHTDYNDGFVLPMAIDRWTIAMAHPAPGRPSRLWAIDMDEMTTVDLTAALAPMPGKAANYALGVAQQFIERGHRLPNLDVAITSSVPIGAGLSSSAALEVAIATLLEEALNVRLEPVEKALLCQRAEHQFPGTPCGIMDMLTAVMARPQCAMLIDCRSQQAQFVPMPPAEQAAVLIIDTQVKHELAASEYAQRRRACASVAEKLGLKSLRDATVPMLNRGGIPPPDRKKALHVIAENARTVLAATALGAGDLAEFGELMFASHDSLRDLYEVSCPELDVLIEAARTLREHGVGIFGARMTGGGFGGCAVALCRGGAVETIMHHLNEAFRAAFDRECEMFTTGAAGGARALQLGATSQGGSNAP